MAADPDAAKGKGVDTSLRHPSLQHPSAGHHPWGDGWLQGHRLEPVPFVCVT